MTPRALFHPQTSPLPLWALYALSAYYALAFLIVVHVALGYPYIIEWLEGTTMQIVQRVHDGQAIYVKPTLEYTPFMYTPLYYYVAAGAAWVMGVDFSAGRLVSIVSSIACAGLCAAWLRKEGIGRELCIVAAGMFLAINAAIGGWMHVARVDMLFMALELAGLFVYAHYQSSLSAIAAGLLFALALYTKQQALFITLGVLGLTLFATPKRAGITLAAFTAYTLMALVYFENDSHGWFSVYVYDTPASLPKNYNIFWPFWKRDIFKVMPVNVALSALGLAWLMTHDWRRGLLYTGMLGGMLAAALGSRMHVLGWFNVLLPAYCGLIIVALLSAGILVREGLAARNVMFALLVMQMAILYYKPYQLVPTKQKAEMTRHYFDYIAAIPGEVLIPDLQFVQEQVGKRSYAYRMGAVDVMAADLGARNHVKGRLRGELIDGLHRHQFSAIILPNKSDMPEKNGYYHFKETIINGSDTAFINGAMQYPNYVFVPNDNPNE